MSTTADKTKLIAVVGATGQQGGAVVRERHEILGAHEGSRIRKCAVASAARKLDHPHIVERDVGEKPMRTKVQPLKVRGIYARPSAHPLPFAAV